MMVRPLYIPRKGRDYLVCGQKSICSYCDSVEQGRIGKCGMRKSVLHAYRADADRADADRADADRADLDGNVRSDGISS
jgi:hypothetical protein